MAGFRNIDELAKLLDVEPYEMTGEGGLAYIMEGESGQPYDFFEVLNAVIEKALEAAKEIVK